jgi:hypothetical protein
MKQFQDKTTLGLAQWASSALQIKFLSFPLHISWGRVREEGEGGDEYDQNTSHILYENRIMKPITVVLKRRQETRKSNRGGGLIKAHCTHVQKYHSETSV